MSIKHSKINRIIISVLGILTMLSMALVACTKEKETIKIGCILSLSGPGSHMIDLKDAMLMAVEKVNKWGGVNGKKIELIIEDSKTDPAEGEKAFGRIEKTHHPVLYISTQSSVSIALAPLAEKNSVPLVGLVTSAQEFTKINDWVFRYYSVAKNEVSPIIYLMKTLKIKNLGILYQNDPYGKSVYELLKERSEKTGIIIKARGFETKATEFRGQIKELNQLEAVYVVGFVNSIGKILGQLKDEQYAGVILAASGAVSNSVRTLPEANGVYVTAPALYNPNYLFARDVKKQYETRYGKPLIHQAASGYDFITLLTGLMEGKVISRTGIKQLLEGGFIHTGVFGKILVKPGEHEINFPLYPAQIVQGQVQYMRR